ncbi:MAG: ribosomal protein S18-alanine N-acetyltransferase [Chloroflexota bacterium]
MAEQHVRDSSEGGRTRYWIRPMREDDIPQVLDIDHEAFSTQWPPVSYASLKQELKNRMAHYVVLCASGPDFQNPPVSQPQPGIWKKLKARFAATKTRPQETAMPRHDRLIGFAGTWKIYDEAHIISIAVRQMHRRRGFGELLMLAVVHMAFQLQSKVITLEVRVSNHVAQELYVKYGFRSAGVRHRYYTDNNEDALIMTTEPINSDSFKANYQRLRQSHINRWPVLYHAT